MSSARRALLLAALGFLRLRDPPPEVAPLRRWLDPDGWRATFIRRDHSTRPWVGQVLRFHPTPWEAVQRAAWSVLD